MVLALDLPDKEVGCHRCAFEKKCRDLVTSGLCNRWIQISGTNPNTGEEIHHYDCVDNWGPMLMVENSQQTRQTAAAIESLRNEVVQAQKIANMLSAAAIQTRMLEQKNEDES